MSRKKLITGLVCILLITSITALTRNYLEAGWSNRATLASDAETLRQLPEQIGDWICTTNTDLPEIVQRTLKCHGYVNRSYSNAKTGATINVAILFGPRGPIAVHTPEICYSGIGTRPLGDRQAVEIDIEDRSDRFWNIQFARGNDPSPSLDVWYAWSDGGPWLASERPRYWMTENLYKIQLAGSPSQRGTESDCKNFLKALLPILRQKLRSEAVN